MTSKPVTAQIKHETLFPPDKLDLVQVENVIVQFDGFKALDIHYFGIDRNELRVVVGPNGAGKTTLCDVISGKTRVATGRVVSAWFGHTRGVTHVARSYNHEHVATGSDDQTVRIWNLKY